MRIMCCHVRCAAGRLPTTWRALRHVAEIGIASVTNAMILLRTSSGRFSKLEGEERRPRFILEDIKENAEV